MSQDRALHLQLIQNGQALIHRFRDERAARIKKSLQTLWDADGVAEEYEAKQAERQLQEIPDEIRHLDVIQTLLDKDKAQITQPIQSARDEKKATTKKHAHHASIDVDGLWTHQLSNPNSRLYELNQVKEFLRLSIMMGEAADKATLNYLFSLVKKEMALQMMEDCRAMLVHIVAEAKGRDADLFVHFGTNRQSKTMDDHNGSRSLSLTEIFPFVPGAIASIDPEMQVTIVKQMQADMYGNHESGFTYDLINQSLKSDDYSRGVEVMTDDTKITLWICQGNHAVLKFPQYESHSFAGYDDRGHDILAASFKFLSKNPHVLPLEVSLYEFPSIRVPDGSNVKYMGLTQISMANDDFQFSTLSKSEFPVVRLIGTVQGTGKPDPHYQENCMIRCANFMDIKLEGDVRKAISRYTRSPISVHCDVYVPEKNKYLGDLRLTHNGNEPEAKAAVSATPSQQILTDEEREIALFWERIKTPNIRNRVIWPQFFAPEPDLMASQSMLRPPALNSLGLPPAMPLVLPTAGDQQSAAAVDVSSAGEQSTAGESVARMANGRSQ